MKTSVTLDDELVTEVARTAALLGENPAAVLRLAIRAGLPRLAQCFQAPRPAGYFQAAYQSPDAERVKLEAAMLQSPQSPER